MQNRHRSQNPGAWWAGQGAHPNAYHYPAVVPHYGQGYYGAATPGQRHPQLYQQAGPYYDGSGAYPTGDPFNPYTGNSFTGRFTTDRSLPPVTPQARTNPANELEPDNSTSDHGEEKAEGVELHHTLHCSIPNHLFDVRQKPEWSLQDKFRKHCYEPAVHGAQCDYIRLVSRDFPWTISIKPFSHAQLRYVTCGDILYGLHFFLNQKMDSLDWRLVLFQDEDTREAMQDAIKEKVDGNPKYQARKVDWLQKKFFFRGLVKDDEFASSLLPPGKRLHPYTYVVKMVECE